MQHSNVRLAAGGSRGVLLWDLRACDQRAALSFDHQAAVTALAFDDVRCPCSLTNV